MAQKILVVDDEPELLLLICDELRREGYEVISAVDGMDALSKARHERPDLVLLDVMLPKMNGFQVCRMLKFDRRYQHIPIVFLTVRKGEADRKLSEDVHADSYFVKPFERDAMLAKVKECLANRPAADDSKGT